MSPQSNHDSASDPPSANEILASILEEVGDVSSLLELFYLSREPGVLEVLHWVASLPEKPRGELMEFVQAAGKRKKAIRLKRTGDGALVLTAQPPSRRS
jgi:hypothetical protein